MCRLSPVKLALLEISWLRLGFTPPASPAPGLLTALCPASAGILPVVGRGPTLGTNNRQHRRRTMRGGADSSLAQSGGAIEFLTQPARERGDDTGVIFE